MKRMKYGSRIEVTNMCTYSCQQQKNIVIIFERFYWWIYCGMNEDRNTFEAWGLTKLTNDNWLFRKEKWIIEIIGYERIGDKRIGNKRIGDKRIGDKRIGDKRIGNKRIGDKRIGDKTIGDKYRIRDEMVMKKEM